MWRRSAEIANGIAIALGGKPNREYFDAVCETEEEAEQAAWQATAAQLEQDAIERYKRGG